MSHGQQVQWPGWTSALVIGILASSALLAAQPAAAALQEDSKSPDADVRKQGEWTVTRLGGRSSYTSFFDKAHRLFLNPEDHPPELWDTVTGKRIAVLRDAPSQIGALTESPDGKQFLIGEDIDHLSPQAGSTGASARIFIRDARTGSAVKHIDVDVSAPKFADVTDWRVFWGDQNRLFLNFLFRSSFNRASASFQSILGLIDVTTGKVLQMSDLLPITENLLGSPDGTLAIDGNPLFQGITVRTNILDLDTFKIVTTLDKPRPPRNPTPGHQVRVITHRAWAPDSSKVATVSDDGDIAIWQPRTGKLLRSIDAYPESVGTIHFSPDGRKLLTTSETDKARLWDANNGKLLLTLSGHTAPVNDAVFDSKGERIVSVSDDGTARLWDARSGKMLRTFVDDRTVTSAEFVEHDKQIRTVNDLNVERTWSVNDGTRLSEKAIVQEDGHYGVCFVRDGDKYSEIWVGPPGKSPPEPRFKGFVFYPGGKPMDQLVSAKRSLKGHTGLILALATTPDGKLLASAGQDKTVDIWDLARWNRVTGEGRRTLVHGESVQRLAFTPDGKLLAAGGEGGTIRIWDVTSGQEVKSLKAHTQQRNLWMKGVQGLAFTPDGRTLVSGGGDFTVKVWDWHHNKVRLFGDNYLSPLATIIFPHSVLA